MNNLPFVELEMADLILVDGGGVIDDVLMIGTGGTITAGGCLTAYTGATAIAAKAAVVVAGISMPAGLVLAAGIVGITAGVTLIGCGVNSLLN